MNLLENSYNYTNLYKLEQQLSSKEEVTTRGNNLFVIGKKMGDENEIFTSVYFYTKGIS